MPLYMQFVNSQPTAEDEEHSDLDSSISSGDRSFASVAGSKRIKEHSDLDSSVSDDTSFASVSSKRIRLSSEFKDNKQEETLAEVGL